MTASNKTTVPTEWFQELIGINNKIIEASTPPVNEKDWSFYIGCLQSHIYNYKYFTERPSESLVTPFGESLRLLRDLADLQNGPPLEQYGKEWEKTMDEVYTFLKQWDEQKQPSENVDLEELVKWFAMSCYEYDTRNSEYFDGSKYYTFSEVVQAFKNREK